MASRTGRARKGTDVRNRVWQSLLVLGIVAIVAALVPLRAGATPAEEQAAEKAAVFWLNLADRDFVDKTYEESSSIFKEKVKLPEWRQAMAQTRAQVGKKTQRTLVTKKLVANPPGAPPGRYFMLSFKTQFARTGETSETLTMLCDKDTRWRMAGYFVKPSGAAPRK